MSAVNKELWRRFTELFSTGDEALAEEVLSPEVVMYGSVPSGELDGLDAVKEFVAALWFAPAGLVHSFQLERLARCRALSCWCLSNRESARFLVLILERTSSGPWESVRLL